MKKIFAVLFIFVASLVMAEYEYPAAFKNNDKIVQGGLGFGLAGVYGDVVIPPVSLSFDMAKEIEGFPLSFGGIIGISKSEEDYGWGFDDYTWSWTYFLLGARGAWHFKLDSKKLDPYAGLMLGYTVVSFEEPDGWNDFYGSVDTDSYLIFGAYCGARYFFNENWAAYGELGYGFGYLNLGLSYKFQ